MRSTDLMPISQSVGAAMLILASASYAAAPDLSGANRSFHIIPQPLSVAGCAGTVALDRVDIDVADERFEGIAEYVRARLPINEGSDTDPQETRLLLAASGKESLGDEGYELLVLPPADIEIRARAAAGAFYAVQTLLQLMPPAIYADSASSLKSYAVPCVRVTDTPRFEWRGYMLDVSRHFFSKDRVKTLIKQMAMHKLNRLHLHLTDNPAWRIELERYPRLTEIGAVGNESDPQAAPGFFTRRDVEEMVAYARHHYITIVPEIDMPGHGGSAARAYPEHFDGHITWNIGRPETVAFAKQILSDVIEMFPGEYVHFGGDELRRHNLQALPDVRRLMAENGYTSIHQVEAHFSREIAAHILSKGRTPLAWDEVSAFGLDRRTLVQWWRIHRPESRKRAVEAGHRLIFSPADPVYFDYSQAPGEPGAPWEGNDNGPNTIERVYQWEPIPEDFTAQERELVLGVEAALWTEFIHSEGYLEFMTFPRLAALAEVAWAEEGTRKDLRFFKDKLKSQFQRYGALGINYRMPGEDGDPAARNAARYLRN